MILGILFGWAVGTGAQEALQNGEGFNLVGHNFFAIQVEDDSSAAEWYQSVFGLEEVNRLAAADLAVRILTGPGLTVELIRMDDALPRPEGPQRGLFKVGFMVDDIEGALAWLKGRGVEADHTISMDRALQVRTFVLRDLEGNRLQVFEPCDGNCDRRQN